MGLGGIGRMLRRGGLAVILLTASVLAAGLPGASANPAGVAVLTGQVTAHDTGQPLVGICVRLLQWAGLSPTNSYTRTDPQGRYVFTAQQQRSTLFFTDCRSAPRYAATEEDLGYLSNDLNVYNEAMPVGAQINGMVTTAPDGAPMPDACTYTFQAATDHQGNPVWYLHGPVGTNKSGRYHLGLLNPAPASIGTFPCERQENAYQQCFSNNISTPQTCVPLWEDSPYAPVTDKTPIAEGATVKVATELPVGGVIEGRVTTSTGAPAANVSVRLWDDSISPLYDYGDGRTFTDANGNYRLEGLRQYTNATLYFYPPAHTVYNEFATAGPFTIGPGQTITGIDATEPPGCAGC